MTADGAGGTEDGEMFLGHESVLFILEEEEEIGKGKAVTGCWRGA